MSEAGSLRDAGRPIAVTGGTGFVGRHVLTELAATGRPVRVLARRPGSVALSSSFTVIPGSLDDMTALRALTDGSSAVIHCAGVIAAPTRAAYHAANADGTARLLQAMPRGARLVHVSSLAARRPELSSYAESKQRAEMIVMADEQQPHVVVRPPAVYGPGDRATLPIFRQLLHGLLVVPARRVARFSLIFCEDLARLLVSLALGGDTSAGVSEPDDGHAGGYAWRDLATIAGEATGRRVRMVRIPPTVAWPLAAGSEIVARMLRRRPLLDRDKLRELAHPDWVCRPAALPADWRPRVDFAAGFATAVAWYRREGWL